MRITTSLILLLGLSTESAAQDNKPQPSQTGSQNAQKTKRKHPQITCSPGTLSVTSPFSSGGGSGVATWSYYSAYCGSPIPTSTATWISFNDFGTQCNVAGDLNTCTTPFTVAANTGSTRTGAVIVSLGSFGQDGPAYVTQYGPPETLTVSVSGSGRVTSSPSGISCPGTCSVGFTLGTTVTLTASASTGYSFSGWSGPCSGTGTCTLTMNSPMSVSATFTAIPETLSVTVSGSGTVISSPSGISCPGVCATSFSYGTVVYLTATPSNGYGFAGWSGACSGTGTCALTMNGAKM